MTDTLPDIALSAWKAYRSMEVSKGEYFGYLEELEDKYKSGGSRTIAESTRLGILLKEHERKVADFSNAMKALKDQDSGAHQALISHITMLNAEVGKTGGLKPS